MVDRKDIVVSRRSPWRKRWSIGYQLWVRTGCCGHTLPADKHANAALAATNRPAGV